MGHLSGGSGRMLYAQGYPTLGPILNVSVNNNADSTEVLFSLSFSAKQDGHLSLMKVEQGFQDSKSG